MKLLTFIHLMALVYQTFGQEELSTLLDTRDLKSYRQVQVGEKLWMADNLNYNIDYQYFYYLSGNETFYSGYNLTSDTLCPEGWRIPTIDDFEELVTDQLISHEGFMILNDNLKIDYPGYLFEGALQNRHHSAAYWALWADESDSYALKAVLIQLDKEEETIDLVEADDKMLASCRCIKY